MMTTDDFLVEIQTEELPPKALLKLARAFEAGITERLKKAGIPFEESGYFATPRRLAVFIKNVAAAQPDQLVERKGPALKAAFDAEGRPTPACVGFARSCGVTPDALMTIKNDQGEWVAYQQTVAGQAFTALAPSIVVDAALALPTPKRMRWGNSEEQFVRPVHAVVLLYGDQVISADVLGCRAGRVTHGHRFHAPDAITIPHAAAYLSLMQSEGKVMADFAARKETIRQTSAQLVNEKLGGTAVVMISSDDLLDEVTGLVEWPVALLGQFDRAFLDLPQEVLISSMQDHQRYFPVTDAKGQLLSYFVTISNIESHDPARVVHGNERVLRARLSDAAFFFAADKQISLMERTNRLKGIVFQAKLGTLDDKSARIAKLAVFIAEKMGADTIQAERAALLAKADLTTQMVGEFPELQGVMGYYYTKHDGETEAVAWAIREHYLPRFAGDKLPQHAIGQAVAIADRLDTLVGAFGINQAPTGDKDPYGLRRAALGVIRILNENKMDLDLKLLLEFAILSYQDRLENASLLPQLLHFFQERLRVWYQEQGVSADIFAAVAALNITNLTDMHERIKAVQAFKKLNVAETLSIANKRVSNILSKYAEDVAAKIIDPGFFEHPAEQELAHQLEAKSHVVAGLSQSGQYEDVLRELAELRKPIDDFFDHVMVMTEDKSRRENRLLLLSKLRTLFLQVADIALLQ